MSSSNIGFVGVGQMGAPMVTRLIKAGYKPIIFDTNSEAVKALARAGAVAAASAEEVSAAAEIVLVSLPTPDILKAVVLGDKGLSGGARMRVLIDLSTTGPRMAKVLADALQDKNVAWADAPVSGGVAGAENGTLAVMLSCPAAHRADVESLLKNFGTVYYVGEVAGQAQIAKLANNMLSVSAIVMTSEVMAMAVKAGLDPQTLLDIINAGSGRNTATQDKFPRQVLTRKFRQGFALGLALKDVKLCIDEAAALGVPMVSGSATNQILTIATSKYGANADFTVVARLLEDWTNVEIRSRSVAADATSAAKVAV